MSTTSYTAFTAGGLRVSRAGPDLAMTLGVALDLVRRGYPVVIRLAENNGIGTAELVPDGVDFELEAGPGSLTPVLCTRLHQILANLGHHATKERL